MACSDLLLCAGSGGGVLLVSRQSFGDEAAAGVWGRWARAFNAGTLGHRTQAQ
jgi:hypothetical protein